MSDVVARDALEMEIFYWISLGFQLNFQSNSENCSKVVGSPSYYVEFRSLIFIVIISKWIIILLVKFNCETWGKFKYIVEKSGQLTKNFSKIFPRGTLEILYFGDQRYSSRIKIIKRHTLFSRHQSIHHLAYRVMIRINSDHDEEP